MTLTQAEREHLCRIKALPAHTPQIGLPADMLTSARSTTLQAVRGLSVAELDATPPGFTHSIGTRLAHIAATDRSYQHLSFGGVTRWSRCCSTARPTSQLRPSGKKVSG